MSGKARRADLPKAKGKSSKIRNGREMLSDSGGEIAENAGARCMKMRLGALSRRFFRHAVLVAATGFCMVQRLICALNECRNCV